MPSRPRSDARRTSCRSSSARDFSAERRPRPRSRRLSPRAAVSRNDARCHWPGSSRGRLLSTRVLRFYGRAAMLRDAFGRLRPVRWGMINLGGYLTVLQLRVLNKLRIEGVENLKSLPSRGVLLVSNHLTYYMDAIVVFHSVSYLRRPYLIWPRTDFYIVAALETMRARGWLPRLMAYNGTITVKRTWKEGDQAVQRAVDPEDIAKVNTGLQGGWVLTFPQGTTAPGAPGRMGTARIIKEFRPLVVPVRLSGLREAFDKTGLKLRRMGTELSVKYGRALDIDYDAEPAEILQTVMAGIGEA
ncbi:MAG: 1-acyl-sn-glycerol-3-phosphate acyltransferase [Deltaproteobacteria bacterium]|nr:1-acyl-sn-glycerol-3-phosphate acyltransferase [Deltaproteobacteria bacterium]